METRSASALHPVHRWRRAGGTDTISSVSDQIFEFSQRLNRFSAPLLPNTLAQHWDDFLRVAGSLKMGTVRASELIRSLQRSGRASSLGRAIGELGRIPKTLHLLNFIADPNYRRHILNQLNRGEGCGRISRKVFHGQRGEFRQRYREGQEDQLGALGLVVNALVLWTTRYMDPALNHLRATGTEVRKEDLARLSPLSHKHFNMLGR